MMFADEVNELLKLEQFRHDCSHIAMAVQLGVIKPEYDASGRAMYTAEDVDKLRSWLRSTRKGPLHAERRYVSAGANLRGGGRETFVMPKGAKQGSDAQGAKTPVAAV